MDGRKQGYGHCFVIYGLSAYSRAFGDATALTEAMDLLELLDRYARSPHGGYREVFTCDWQQQLRGDRTHGSIVADRHSCFEIAVLEMLIGLYEASGDGSVRDRLEAQVGLLLERMIDHDTGHGYIRTSEDWTPEHPPRVSHAHDIKLAWLVLKAADLLERADDPAIVEPTVTLADRVWRYGFDPRHGVYDEGWPGRPADDRCRLWWAQSEAMVAFLVLHQRTGEPRWREAFERQALYALNRQVDHRCGEWYTSISPRGRIDFYKRQDPYHHTRACLEIIRRLRPDSPLNEAPHTRDMPVPAGDDAQRST